MLGEQVRNIRKKRGITLKELAEKTGLSIGYISQIERDLTDPSLSTLRKLSAALDIPTYLFMGGESSTSLTTRQADMMILSQPNSNVRYHLLTPMPNGNFVPQSLVIRFELEPHCKDGDLPVIHPSEEILLLEREMQKLEQTLGGIKNMDRLPQLAFIIDPHREDIAVKECRKLGIPIVAVTDTNCDPDVIDYIIPGNDDAIRAIKLFVTAFSEACQEGEAQMKDGAAVEANAEEAMQKAAETEAAAE